LPEYAVPSSFHVVERIPLTSSGKIDRAALSPLAATAVHDHPRTEPRSPLEEAICAAVRDVLGCENIGVRDDFFAAGGHSLAALRVLSLIKQHTGIALQTLDFFDDPTVAGLAVRAEQRRLDPDYAVPGSDRFIVELRSHGKDSPIFIMPGGWGEANEILVFAGLFNRVAADRPRYAVRSRALDASRALPERLEEYGREIVQAIAAVSGERPFVIVGECAASTLALTLTACAEQDGRAIEMVVLLDPGPLSNLSSLLDRTTRSSARPFPERSSNMFASEAPMPRPPVPERVAQYYRLLSAWQPRPIETPLHVILSSRFTDIGAVRTSWLSLARGPLSVHPVPGNHDSYIREHAHATAQVLALILTRSDH